MSDNKRKTLIFKALCALFVAASGFFTVYTCYNVAGHTVDAHQSELQSFTRQRYAAYRNKLEANFQEDLAEVEKDDHILCLEIKDNTVPKEEILDKYGINVDNIKVDDDGTYVYLIQTGDTLSAISRVFGYSVDEIANLNQIRNVNIIHANTSMRLPNTSE